MRLRELELKKSYINQGSENIVDCLINPALKCANIYKRSVGFFSSEVFNLIIGSLSFFIKNNGKIQLIVSPHLQEDDVEAIKSGYERKEVILNKAFIDDFDREITTFDEVTLNILSELVAHGVLDIKVASVKNDIGMYHDKLGILTDVNGDTIVFYGSANSTINGYKNNYEKIRVSRSWVNGEGESVDDEIREFDLLWDNKNKFVEVYSFMESVRHSIIVAIENCKQKKGSKNPIKLYDYQEEAINAWQAHGYNGFYVMATGTGKTWTAIYSAKRLLEQTTALIVIAAPYKHLVKQWSEDLVKVFPDADILLISSENPQWYSVGRQQVIGQSYDSQKQVIFVTTISSFYSDKFDRLMALSKQDKLLIVDEAHRFTKRDASLKDTFKYMLGLSATPVNGKNNDAGNALVKFFGGQVFSLPIEVALEKGFLVPYYYKPIFVDATEEEEEKFNKLSANMASCFVNNICIDKDKFTKCYRARLRSLAMAEAKISGIDSLLDRIDSKDHFVVYCGDGKLFDGDDEEIRHIQFVKSHLDQLGIRTSQFTATEDMSRRMELVDMFNNNEIAALVAIRCLDEGINIPSIKSALILASNDDYREFVQRRGRILRKYENKESATIYDVIVLPSTDCQKMALIELRRYYEYAKLSINRKELLDDLERIIKHYNIKLEDLMLYTEIETEGEIDE